MSVSTPSLSEQLNAIKVDSTKIIGQTEADIMTFLALFTEQGSKMTSYKLKFEDYIYRYYYDDKLIKERMKDLILQAGLPDEL